MRTKISIIIIFLAIIISNKIFSQEIGVAAGLNETGKVTVRWFSSEEFNKDGVIVYRKEKSESEWLKLTPAPIKRIEEITTGTDTSLLISSALIYNIPDDPEDKETHKLVLLTKGILDKNFAKAYGMEYEDNNVEADKTYEYKVVKLNGEDEDYSGISEPIKIDKYVAPSAPLNFSGTPEDGLIKFKWARDEEKYFAYNIYRGEASSAVKKVINKSPVYIFEFQDSTGNFKPLKFFYKDTSLVNGKTYYYELTGIDYLGRESKRSNQISVAPKDLTPPPAPTSVKGKSTKDGILITWKSTQVNDMKGFDLFRSREFNGPFEKVNKKIIEAKDTSFVDKIKEPPEINYYFVTAEDFSSNKSQSLTALVKIQDATPPAIPVELKAVGDVGKVILSWKKGTEKDLLGYFIYRSVTNTEDEFVLLNPKPVLGNSYIDTLKKEARNFFQYKILAVDKKYNTSEYSAVVNVKMKDITPPPAPFLIEAINEEQSISLKWTGNSLEDVAGFYVFRSDKDDSSKWKQINKILIPPVQNTFADSSLAEGKYFYYIISQDSSGNKSIASNKLSAEYIVDIPLPAVEGFTQKLNGDKSEAALTWTAINNKNLLGYVVFRKENETDNFDLAISLLQKENTFVDKELSSGKTFYYLIKAFDSRGNISQSKIAKLEIR